MTEYSRANLQYHIDNCTQSNKAFQKHSPAFIKALAKDHYTLAAPFFKQVKETLLLEETSPSAKILSLYLLLKVTESELKVLTKHVIQDNQFLLFLSIESKTPNSQAGRYFADSPRPAGREHGEKYIRLLKECIIYWADQSKNKNLVLISQNLKKSGEYPKEFLFIKKDERLDAIESLSVSSRSNTLQGDSFDDGAITPAQRAQVKAAFYAEGGSKPQKGYSSLTNSLTNSVKKLPHSYNSVQKKRELYPDLGYGRYSSTGSNSERGSAVQSPTFGPDQQKNFLNLNYQKNNSENNPVVHKIFSEEKTPRHTQGLLHLPPNNQENQQKPRNPNGVPQKYFSAGHPTHQRSFEQQSKIQTINRGKRANLNKIRPLQADNDSPREFTPDHLMDRKSRGENGFQSKNNGFRSPQSKSLKPLSTASMPATSLSNQTSPKYFNGKQMFLQKDMGSFSQYDGSQTPNGYSSSGMSSPDRGGSAMGYNFPKPKHDLKLQKIEKSLTEVQNNISRSQLSKQSSLHSATSPKTNPPSSREVIDESDEYKYALIKQNSQEKVKATPESIKESPEEENYDDRTKESRGRQAFKFDIEASKKELQNETFKSQKSPRPNEKQQQSQTVQGSYTNPFAKRKEVANPVKQEQRREGKDFRYAESPQKQQTQDGVGDITFGENDEYDGNRGSVVVHEDVQQYPKKIFNGFKFVEVNY